MLYNISKGDLKFQSIKLENQKKYLSDSFFLTKNGELKSLLDISMSANISPRYYAQLSNKVNTLTQFMTSKDCSPVFMTITLDGVYHKLLKGDYSKFTLFHQKKLPENEVNGYLKTKASNREVFTVRDLYQILRFQWRSFLSSWSFRAIKKQGFDVGFLFVTEPHKSGVPHAHILLFIPPQFILPLKDQFKKSFWAKRNLSASRNKLTSFQIKNGEINGYQWTINNAVGYVMKYCTKSFMDILSGSVLDELQAWYMKYKIIRITMSHSLIPQWVYNKIYPLESDWLYLTMLNSDFTCEWSKDDDYFEFEDDNLKKLLRYDKGLYQLYIRDVLVSEFGEKKETIKSSFVSTLKPTLKSLKKYKFIPVKIMTNGVLIDYYKKPISKYTDFDLYKYYKSLDPDNPDLNLHHFGLVQNECIKRGLISGVFHSLNDFNIDFKDSDYAI